MRARDGTYPSLPGGCEETRTQDANLYGDKKLRSRPDQRVWGCGSSERLTSSEKTLSVATYPENIFLKMTNPENVF